MNAKAHMTLKSAPETRLGLPKFSIAKFVSDLGHRLVMDGPEWWDIHPEVLAKKIRNRN
jgi:hypothetical protein